MKEILDDMENNYLIWHTRILEAPCEPWTIVDGKKV
jgi:hypothetical protein